MLRDVRSCSRPAPLTVRQLFLATLLAAPMMLLAGGADSAEGDDKKLAAAPGRLDTTLEHIEARLTGAKPTFVAGATGSLDIRLSLKEGVRWNPGKPLVIQITAPPETGIQFKGKPENGTTLIQLAVPSASARQTM